MDILEIGGFKFTYIEFVCIIAFGFGVVVQLCNYIPRLGFVLSNRKNVGSKFPSISVIITARNYEQELRENLNGVLNQEYPDFEVVVVDDCSFDKTPECLAELKLENPNLKTTTISQETDFSNALAISVGIRAASKEWVVFLHPQCELTDTGWLKSYSKHLVKEKEFVYGYSRLIPVNGFFNRLTHYFSFFYYIFCGGAVRMGATYPYSDINIAYRRKTFLDKKGFAGQLDSRFCENELFSCKLATKKNVCYVPDGQSAVDFNNKLSRKDWLNLRKKHLLLRREFSGGKRFYMRLDIFSRVITNVFLIVLLTISAYYLWILAVWVFRLMLELLLALIAKKRLNENSVVSGFLLYDIFLPFFDVIVRWNLFLEGRQKRWK
jgi:glycosyltransferase involved in cell wall biosynthesis